MDNYRKAKVFFIIFLVAAIVASFSVLKMKQILTAKKAANAPASDSAATTTAVNLEKITGTGEMKKFSSADELKAFLETNAWQPVNYGVEIMGGAVRGGASGANIKLAAPTAFSGAAAGNAGIIPTLAPAVPSGLAADQTTQAGPEAAAPGVMLDYSKTNVQVAGVDEADIIKTDGSYIYAVANNNLFIIKAYPGAQAEIVSKIAFKSRPEDIYINGDSLAVFGQDDQIYTTKIYATFRRQNPYTYFKVFDISDKKNPKQVRDLNFEGDYFDSRMIGDYIYFVTDNYNYAVTPDPVLPRVLDGGAALDSKCGGANVKCYNPDLYYFNIPYDSYNFTSVNAINVKNPAEQVSGNVYLTAAGQTMYVSPDNIYITYTKYISEYDLEMQVARDIIYPKLSSADQDLITKIEATDSGVLSQAEKTSKIQQVLQRYLDGLSSADFAAYNADLTARMKQKYTDLSKELEKTVIYKIAVDKSKLEYQASGEVTGSVLNQFSMDESGDYFRIATTRSQTWSQFADENKDSYNSLYVLDKNLKTVGQIEDLASGEKIYAVRFIGARAYLVTYKQTDPLFAVDLSDPANPQVLGELKIPGFSTYLHPYSDNILIGFGKDAEDLGGAGVKTKGLKLALFDVSDIKNPKVLDTYVMGDMGSDSIALTDHKAFLFSKEKNLLAIPATLRKSTGVNNWGGLSFSGVLVFQINDNKFSLLGKIDHSDGGQTAPLDYWDGYNYYDNTVKRSLYISDELYTFSDQYLKVNSLPDLKEVKNLELKKEKPGDFEVIN